MKILVLQKRIILGLRMLWENILILNPDTIIPENLFESLVEFHQSKEKIGFVGIRMMDTNGNFHPESKRNIPTA